jgi:hypothetical protein
MVDYSMLKLHRSQPTLKWPRFGVQEGCLAFTSFPRSLSKFRTMTIGFAMQFELDEISAHRVRV